MSPGTEDVIVREYKRDFSARTFGSRLTRLPHEVRIFIWFAAAAAFVGAVAFAWIR